MEGMAKPSALVAYLPKVPVEVRSQEEYAYDSCQMGKGLQRQRAEEGIEVNQPDEHEV